MFKNYISHPLQGIASYLFFFLIKLLPITWASGLGGWSGRLIGPRLRISERARRNMSFAFPEKSGEEIEDLVSQMWDNLGRTVMEYPLLNRIQVNGQNPHIKLVGNEYLKLLRDDDKPGLLFTGHLGNWEIPAICISAQGLPQHFVYRAPNNPHVEKLFERRHLINCTPIPKGAKGARVALRALSQGGHLGMLVDQKMNDGIAAPFFGHDAMSAPAVAQFALKFKCPVIPVRVERLQGPNFCITCYPPLKITPSGNKQADILEITTKVNLVLEGWIRERPAQWLWLHNRWPANLF